MRGFLFPEREGTAIWRVIGEDKQTGKTVEVAIADNEAELRIIQREESRNYRNLRAVGMSVPIGRDCGARVSA